MRILLVTERFWPEVGAAPSRLANMAEGMMAEVNEVDVFTSLPNYPKGKIFDGYRGSFSKKETYKNINLFRYWIYATTSRNPIARVLNMFSFAFIIWLFAFKRKTVKKYDLVIIQTPTVVVGASAMLLFKGLFKKKCCINVSDIWPLTAVDMGAMKEGSSSFKFMQKCELYMYRKCDAVLGQSNEILAHVESEMKRIGVPTRVNDTSKLFLYRNLQHYDLLYSFKSKGNPLKIVFSGMLGVAQDVLGIVKNVPFKDMGVEFHIFGGGKQLIEIQDWCSEHPNSNVFAHGFVPKEKIAESLREMDASIIPLVTRIRGAVPSKLFDTLPQGLPILYTGDGEGADFVAERRLGYISNPGDYESLKANINELRDLSSAEYNEMSARCIEVSKKELNFDAQMKECCKFLKKINEA